ncbi:YceH family protein [Motilimonas eburnea]|uniref:YceH family protein n=1 Tax=Motilimonas eburnea TaxID=1737488 RepID=UPI001E464B6D|nr:YceH family protein [Motilimonas eburnea]MCE2573625.1 YceH family protein [Motilimonas eburnea]
MEQDLSLFETRVLGCLFEKAVTTPDYYPLTANSLLTACNQKSNRDPVLAMSELELQNTVDLLVKKRLVTLESGFGSRVNKYAHRFCNTEFGELKLSEAELALICVLFLRGPQTPGELRSRSQRLFNFSDVAEVESTLDEMAQRSPALVKKLPRQAGKRESRYLHLFAKDELVNAPDTSQEVASLAPVEPSELPQLKQLQAEVETLKQQVAQLQQQVNDLMS